ncbi:MAG: sugar kinase [Acidimicrobiia bacterium]|nr:sugar kinase [Acidimicrobiia bacterium]
MLDIRPAADTGFDVVTLGEVMLRLDPGERRVRTARTFTVSEGGGEYNVGRALSRCFGLRGALVTAIGDNDVGRLLEDLLLQSGLNLDRVVWKRSDPVGRSNRTGLNFTERGFGVRGPVGVYDRANSAASSLSPEDVDWDHLFGELGVRWFHTGGIFAGLSETTLEVVRLGLASARHHGTITSYDINYRPSLWAAAGGADAAERITEELIEHVDVLFGVDSEALPGGPAGPQIIATTERTVLSASRHDWQGVAWSAAGGLERSRQYVGLEVLDRVGSGDGFAAGLIYGLLNGRSLAQSLELGTAHGALVMTTPGDTSSATIHEVERLAAGENPSTRR